MRRQTSARYSAIIYSIIGINNVIEAYVYRVLLSLCPLFPHLMCVFDYRSAYLMAAYRPRCPILAITRDAQTSRQMHLYRGIVPIHYKGKSLDILWSRVTPHVYLCTCTDKYKMETCPNDTSSICYTTASFHGATS